MRTLAEMNEKTRERQWEGLVLRSEFAVGRVGRAQSGTKIHLVICEYVASVSGDSRLRVGDLLTAHTPCNGNGQRIGQPIRGLDTDAITCGKCLS